MASPPLVLLHSPLVGPTAWREVADRLVERAYDVQVPTQDQALQQGPPFHQRIAESIARQVGAEGRAGLVLVGHSGAGPLLPQVADALDADVAGAIYVDSLLPRPGVTWFDRAPPGLAQHLRDLAEGGQLPPWDQWFEAGAVAELLPDLELRQRFLTELPRLPLAYFEEIASPTRWSGPSAYLLLSENYRPEAEQAARQNWPVVEHVSHHLAMLTEAEAVAAALLDALGALDVP